MLFSVFLFKSNNPVQRVLLNFKTFENNRDFDTKKFPPFIYMQKETKPSKISVRKERKIIKSLLKVPSIREIKKILKKLTKCT